MRVTIRGVWPGRLEVRRGWARADVRPWNRDTPAAHVRLVRGSPGFLAEATNSVLGLGAAAVLSSPVLGSGRMWEEAGFVELVRLVLMRRGPSPAPPPPHPVDELADAERAAALAVDERAFDPFWRVDAIGLADALDATPRSVLLGVWAPRPELAGFAVVGVSGRLGYLQRVAVDPVHQGQAVGRSLTRAAARWARSRGADELLLNTKPGNEAALGLYASEGFERLPDRLAVYGFPPGPAGILPGASHAPPDPTGSPG